MDELTKLDKQNIEDIMALTPVQEGMLFHYLHNPASEQYFEQLSLGLSGDINSELIMQAWTVVQQANEMLRAVFFWENLRKPIQVVFKKFNIPFTVCDLSHYSKHEQEKQLSVIRERDRKQRIDITLHPFRILLCRTGSRECEMIISNHHILYDGWSNGVLLKEFLDAYQSLARGALPHRMVKTRYKEFIVWQQKQDTGKQRQFWKEYLWNFDTKTALPVDFEVEKSTEPVQSCYVELPGELQKAIPEFSKKHSLPPASLLCTAWGMLLQKYNNPADVVFGITVSGRTPEISGIDAMVGLFINTLPLRVKSSDGVSVLELLRMVDTGIRECGEFAATPLTDIKACSALDPESGLFDSIVVIENYPLDPLLAAGRYNLNVKVNSLFEMTNYALTLAFSVSGRISLNICYHPGAFSGETIKRITEHYICLLNGILAAPQARVEEIAVLSAAEQQQLLAGFNNTRADYPREKTIQQLFEEQVQRTPGQTAIICGSRELTYAALNARANSLAHLLAAKGVQPETITGILTTHSIETVIGILAVIKAGGAYLPVDPDYPADRIGYMLDDAGAAVLLTNCPLPAGADFQGEVMDLTDAELYAGDVQDPEPAAGPANLVYVIYTSGSTGQPKGVMIEHRGLVNYIWWAKQMYTGGENEVFPLYSSFAFDLTVTSLFTPLISGHKIIVYRDDADEYVLYRIMNENRATIIKLTPAHLSLLKDRDNSHSSVRRFIVGGEDLKAGLARDIEKSFGGSVEIYNEYGPTETVVGCMIHKFDAARNKQVSVPIGIPAHNVQIYILDKCLKPVPVGIAGEMYISGDGVARGYLNRPELTAEKFMDNPFVPGTKMYRSGDLAYRCPDGSIAFLGRIDDQVKVRGYRIELGEIEDRLLKHKQVKEAAVIARQGSSGTNELYAYVAVDGEVSIRELRRFLGSGLPDYMVPQYFVQLDKLPLTSNGKINRKALPGSGAAMQNSAVIQAPRNALETELLQIWKQVLNRDTVGINDNFFDAGGHSLLLMQFHNKIRGIAPQIAMVDLFAYPTIKSLADRIRGHKEPAGEERLPSASEAGELPRKKYNTDIAVIGMACRFPGAAGIDALWENLAAGRECISFFTEEELEAAGIEPEEFKNPHYVKAGGVLENIEYFDAAFFGFNPREAELLDPQHRLFLECSWEALEHSGCHPGKYPGRIGMFAGACMNTYLFNLLSNREMLDAAGSYQVVLSNDKDYLATRTSYKLNLKGPSITIQTACSTSLVAIHMACRSLLSGECSTALAGGVTVRVPHTAGYLYQQGAIFSPDGHCRAFDAEAAGTVGGNGAGVVVLKPLEAALEEGDCIYAVIKGSAVNNDGDSKVGFTAPSIEGQADVIHAAQAAAGIKPGDICFIEAHGTGTTLGDPMEIAALSRIFPASDVSKHYCAVGSVKTNIGHLDAAAGVAGFIKAVLSLKNRRLPASLHFNRLNPKINLENSAFYINSSLKDLAALNKPLAAGVSSFGIGGTNAHVILAEAPVPVQTAGEEPYNLLVLSAHTAAALEALSRNLADHLAAHPHINLTRAAYTLQMGRGEFAHRRTLVCRSSSMDYSALNSQGAKRVFTHVCTAGSVPALVFMFPGQGAQYVHMGQGLYAHEPAFKAVVDYCAERLEPLLKSDIRKLLFSDNSAAGAADSLTSTAMAQPALFVIEYATAKLFMEKGIVPEIMIGHSIGEYAAACLAGVFTLDEALELVALRGKLMQSLPAGAMLAVFLPEPEVRKFLNNGISLAAVNSAQLCVLSGATALITQLKQKLEAAGTGCRLLHTSHAFHSHMMDPVLEQFEAAVKKLTLKAPQIPFISNVTGCYITAEEACDPHYWALHLRSTVCFHKGIAFLTESGGKIFLETGPGRTLGTLAAQHPANTGQIIIQSLPAADQETADKLLFLEAVGKLWACGLQVRWQELYKEKKPGKIPLPVYPFQRQRYWVEYNKASSMNITSNTEDFCRKTPDEWFYAPAWKQTVGSCRLNGQLAAGDCRKWLLLADDLGLAEALAAELTVCGQEALLVLQAAPDSVFDEMPADRVYRVKHGAAAEYERLFKALKAHNHVPDYILYCRGIYTESSPDKFMQESFHNLVQLFQAIGSAGIKNCMKMCSVTNNMFRICGEKTLYPGKALATGVLKTASQEYPGISCRNIDITLPGTGAEKQQLLKQLVRECAAPCMDPVVALRGSRRWVYTYEPLAAGTGTPAGSRLRAGGVYLITGGLGGIGLALAAHIGAQVQAELYLLSRAEFPARTAWEACLQDESTDEKTRSRIRQILQIGQKGSRVTVLRADAADRQQMHCAVQEIHRLHRQVHGIIHAAGLPAGKMLQLMKPESSNSVMAPKVTGTLILDELLKTDNPDFFVLCSSLNAVTGGFGQADYAAANAFLDAFARDSAEHYAGALVSINWDTWKETGMAAGATLPAEAGATAQKFLADGITTQEGLQAFDRILTLEGVSQVVVSTHNLDQTIKAVEAMAAGTDNTGLQPGQQEKSLHPRPALATEYIAPRTPVEQKLADIWGKILGINRVGILDNFFDLGGNSLAAVQLVSLVNREFAAGITVVSLFEGSHISALASILDPTGQKEEAAAGEAGKARGELRRSGNTRRMRTRPGKEQQDE